MRASEAREPKTRAGRGLRDGGHRQMGSGVEAVVHLRENALGVKAHGPTRGPKPPQIEAKSAHFPKSARRPNLAVYRQNAKSEPRAVSLHTREVAGSKPAAPIT
jgi:hypothetical protein